MSGIKCNVIVVLDRLRMIILTSRLIVIADSCIFLLSMISSTVTDWRISCISRSISHDGLSVVDRLSNLLHILAVDEFVLLLLSGSLDTRQLVWYMIEILSLMRLNGCFIDLSLVLVHPQVLPIIHPSLFNLCIKHLRVLFLPNLLPILLIFKPLLLCKCINLCLLQ